MVKIRHFMLRSLSLNNWTLFKTRLHIIRVDVEGTNLVKGSLHLTHDDPRDVHLPKHFEEFLFVSSCLISDHIMSTRGRYLTSLDLVFIVNEHVYWVIHLSCWIL